MKALVVAEHDNDALTQASLSTITAAHSICGEGGVLVAGHGCDNAAATAATVAGIARVYHADAAHYAHGLAEGEKERAFSRSFPFLSEEGKLPANPACGALLH